MLWTSVVIINFLNQFAAFLFIVSFFYKAINLDYYIHSIKLINFNDNKFCLLKIHLMGILAFLNIQV